MKIIVMRNLLFLFTILFPTVLTFGQSLPDSAPKSSLVRYHAFNNSFKPASQNRYRRSDEEDKQQNIKFTTGLGDRSNHAIQFNGKDSYIKLGITGLSHSMSYAFWMKASNSTGLLPVLFARNKKDGNSITLALKDGFIALALESDAYTGNNHHPNLTSSKRTVVADGNWHFVAITKSAISSNIFEYKVYVDGKLAIILEDETYNKPHKNLYLGHHEVWEKEKKNSWFKGAIDDLYIYKKPLEAQEIQKIFQSEKSSNTQMKVVL